ncbi:ATP-dependent Clp protease ATP-binding subunit ClpX [bacterium AB1]|nr:ATP-dependent Clp protease ATP-binding subunit ClpX [bacterium AB1]
MENNQIEDFKILCGFCKKKSNNIDNYFYSNEHKLYICSQCINVLSKHSFLENTKSKLTPRKIYNSIKEYIVGQDDAAMDLSLVLYKHLLLINNPDDGSIKKIRSNSLILGSTGTGKTYMLEVASKILGVPFLCADMSGVTAIGYVGKDIESIFYDAYKIADCNANKLKHAIIFFDEFDKIAAGGTHEYLSKDVKSGVQQELLKIFEGFPIEVSPDPKRPFQTKIKIQTDGMLFIAGGAFQNIQTIIKKRAEKEIVKVDRFYNYENGVLNNKSLMFIIRDEIINSGIIPELAARFQSIIGFKDLLIEDYLQILNHHDGRLFHYLNIFLKYNFVVVVPDNVRQYFAELAHKLNVGARGLIGVIDMVFNRYFLDIDNKSNTEHIVSIEEINFVMSTHGSAYLNKK